MSGDTRGSLFDLLKSRGFVYQCTDEQGLRELLACPPATCYIGFDPTADSLHVGSLVPLMALRHARRAGHRVILLVGGGTAMVGDPSGKQKMRPMMSEQDIRTNSQDIRSQLLRVVESGVESGPPALVLDNAEWLAGLGYIAFLRDVGRHMSVNRMLSRESARRRYDSKEGLSLIEFNYSCLQSYDFLHLFREHGCRLQMGGQDQWGNICEGIDLISRPEMGGGRAFGLTFPLLVASSGEKFGKTAEGAVWLEARRTPPFDFYQYWRSCDDSDVERLLLLFTELDEGAIREGHRANINRSKEILAYEATRLVHGRQAASEAYRTAVSRYGSADSQGAVTLGSDIPAPGDPAAGADAVPVTIIPVGRLPIDILDIAVAAEFARSRTEARRLVEGGGVTIDGERIADDKRRWGEPAGTVPGSFVLGIGKKRRRRITFG